MQKSPILKYFTVLMSLSKKVKIPVFSGKMGLGSLRWQVSSWVILPMKSLIELFLSMMKTSSQWRQKSAL